MAEAAACIAARMELADGTPFAARRRESTWRRGGICARSGVTKRPVSPSHTPTVRASLNRQVSSPAAAAAAADAGSHFSCGGAARPELASNGGGGSTDVERDDADGGTSPDDGASAAWSEVISSEAKFQFLLVAGASVSGAIGAEAMAAALQDTASASNPSARAKTGIGSDGGGGRGVLGLGCPLDDISGGRPLCSRGVVRSS